MRRPPCRPSLWGVLSFEGGCIHRRGIPSGPSPDSMLRTAKRLEFNSGDSWVCPGESSPLGKVFCQVAKQDALPRSFQASAPDLLSNPSTFMLCLAAKFPDSDSFGSQLSFKRPACTVLSCRCMSANISIVCLDLSMLGIPGWPNQTPEPAKHELPMAVVKHPSKCLWRHHKVAYLQTCLQ